MRHGFEETAVEFRIDVASLEAMHKAGVFGKRERRVVLLAGKLYEMAPIGSGHAVVQSHLLTCLNRLIGDIDLRGTLVAGSGTLTVSTDDAPQPDGMVVPATTDRFYFDAEEARLVCEVSWSSLRDDLGAMRLLYARAGIPEYWVLDAQGRELHVFREPDEGDFRLRELFKPGDRIAPLFAEGRAEIAVADLFS